MDGKTVDVGEIQTRLPELLFMVAEGEEITLTKDDQPVARLVPPAEPTKRRVAGLNPGAVVTSDDFDEPLPDELWLDEE